MAEEVKQSSHHRKVSEVVLADKSEHKHMLSLMNVVISEREHKFSQKKRDIKFRDKHKQET